jgi:hypothetical protein
VKVIEPLVWIATLLCGVVLLSSWFHARTTHTDKGGGQMIQGWGWQHVGTLAGIVTIAALLYGGSRRPHVFRSAFSAFVAAFAMAVAAAETARTWLDITRETLTRELAGPGRFIGFAPSPGTEFTVVVALSGTACALVLLGLWLRPDEGK